MTTYIEVAQALVSSGYLSDADIEAAAEDEIEAAYRDAASALLAAELIDEVNLDNVAAIIADVWIVEEE